MNRLREAIGAAALVLGALAGRAGAQAPAVAPPSDTARAARLERLIRQGHWAEAAAGVRTLRAAAPADERIGVVLASLLAVSGDARGAAALYDTLLRAPDASESAYLAAARFWLGAGRADLAAGVADRGIERHPRSGRLLLTLGEAEAARERWTDAAAAYRRAAPLLPLREDAELPLMGALVAAQDTAAALALGRELADRPASRVARLVVAERADSLGAVALADTIYRALLARDSLDVDALEAAARLAERTGDTTRAVALFTRGTGDDASGAEAPLALLRLTSPGPDSSRALLRRGLWHGMAAVERLEMGAAGMAGRARVGVGPTAGIERARERRAREALVATLDRVVLGEPWGADELEQLRLAWPGSPLLERYAAQVAERRGDDGTALAAVDRLLRGTPDDAALQRTRARLLERTGRPAEAAQALARALDIAPEDDSTFRALERLEETRGSLGTLLAQVQRLRIRLPDSRVLADHETEVRERLAARADVRAPASQSAEAHP